MPDFRTALHWPASHDLISLEQPVITMGSCFADVLGNYLQQHKFKTLTTPFGIAYNPVSIHQHLRMAIGKEPVATGAFIDHQGIHQHYQFHSVVSALSREVLDRMLHDKLKHTGQFLLSAKWLIITYGTAWIYALKDTGLVTANCHKMPAQLFRKELLTQKRILESFEQLYVDLKALNPGLNILLTVSPVRHIKDTLALNSVSKSVLRLACHTLQEQHDHVHYFPAFEIMMDDLRDYRFYKPDMIHPNEVAEQYILDTFASSFIDAKTRSFIETWSGIRKALQHKPFHPQSGQHQQFLQNLVHQLEQVKSLVDVREELELIQKQLNG